MADQRPTTRADFKRLYHLPTRWLDNDIYGHVNNVNYYSFFDTAIANFLMAEGGLDPWADPVIGFCVESGCRFKKAMRYPDTVTAGLRVKKLGRSSVVYEIGLFRGEEDEVAAEGHFVHVFVERRAETPAPIPEKLRTALDALTSSPGD
jgi:acyl-CoA thioester hydrolase